MLIRIALAVALAWPLTGHAGELPKLPTGVTCEQIAQSYAEWSHLGKRAIRLWLSLNGYSRAQQREAEKCLSK